MTDKILKYLSKKERILFPNLSTNKETRKKRADLLIAEAIRNIGKDILKAPAVIVKIL